MRAVNPRRQIFHFLIPLSDKYDYHDEVDSQSWETYQCWERARGPNATRSSSKDAGTHNRVDHLRRKLRQSFGPSTMALPGQAQLASRVGLTYPAPFPPFSSRSINLKRVASEHSTHRHARRHRITSGFATYRSAEHLYCRLSTGVESSGCTEPLS